MEKIDEIQKSLNDPKTPIGLVYVTILLFTQELVNAGIMTDLHSVKALQEKTFSNALQVHTGEKSIQLVHEVDSINE